MTTAAKFLLLLKNKKTRNIIITVCVCIFIFLLMIISIAYTNPQNASEAANIAVREYNYWQSHSPSEDNLSCQGEKYCSYYNYPIADWCCFFAGYCYKEGGLTD